MVAQRQSAKHLSKYKWQKGQSGNPGGMLKGTVCLTTILKRALRDNPDMVNDLVKKVVEQALAGHERSMEMLWNRIDGKVIDKIINLTEIEGWDTEYEVEAKEETTPDPTEIFE